MKDFGIYYADYLKLDSLLSCQLPKSKEMGQEAHDETLFIIIHQAYELWFKQIIHELDSIIEKFQKKYIRERDIGVAVARLERIEKIFNVLVDQLQILETMTPLDFLDFRNLLTPASGFQSFQFRIVEIKLGVKKSQRLLLNQKPFHIYLNKEHQQQIIDSEDQISLFELVEQWLERTPFLEFEGFNFWESYQKAIDKMLADDRETIVNNPLIEEEERNRTLKDLEKTQENFGALLNKEKHNELMKKGGRRLSFKATQAAVLIHLYRDEPILHLPFKLLTLLVDIDQSIAAWRYRHALLALRMIGTKIGTGGTSGHLYLKETIDKSRVFTDFFNIATFLIPRSVLPPLPDTLKQQLGFNYSSK